MKKFLSAFLAAVIMMLGCMPAFAADEIPEGCTPIYSAEDLDNIRNGLAGKYILMNDIDLSAYENWQPIGTVNAPFTGELNGNGYLIRNMKIDAKCSEAENYLGLFGVAENMIFEKVILENGCFSLTYSENVDASEMTVCCGMIAGMVYKKEYAKLHSCSATGNINVIGFGTVVIGGLVGSSPSGINISLSSNYVDSSVTTENYKQNIFVGGLLGAPYGDYSGAYLDIKKSANYGNILINNDICSDETEIIAAGIMSYQISGNKISECYNRGNISVKSTAGEIIVGGVAGKACSRVEKSYNSGAINVTSDENDMISAVCLVEKLGGLGVTSPVLSADYLAYNCYYVSSEAEPCLQYPYESATWYKNIFPLTEEEMRKQESFSKFDFENTWEMEENGYPVLKNQPKITAKETINLKQGETYPIKSGEKCYITTDMNIDMAILEINKNNEIVALDIGTATVTVEHAYNYKTEYKVTVMESETDDSTTNPEPPADNCPMSDWWIVKFVKWLVEAVMGLVMRVFEIIAGVFLS